MTTFAARSRIAAVGLLALLIATTPAVAQPATPESAAAVELKKELTGITEQVIEAIRSGDKGQLVRHLAADMVLINRDGVEYPRQYLIDAIVPMREGYDLRFNILESRLIRRGDAALLTFLLDEYLTIFGHDVSTVYRNHLMYVREDGAWKLALYTYWEKPSTPAAVPVDQAVADAVVGTYELEPGKWVTHVTAKDGKLWYQREGSPARDFVRMTGDRFYIPGVEAEYFFERDANGNVAALVFRRNWIDLRLRRVNK